MNDRSRAESPASADPTPIKSVSTVVAPSDTFGRDAHDGRFAPARFLVELDQASNEGRLCPRGSFDWPEDVFKEMRKTFQLSYSHDRARVFVGTVPQVQAACRWLEREGLRVGRAGEARQAHPPVVCASCEDFAYVTRDLPSPGSPCHACGEPLRFVCAIPHEGECAWRQESAA